MATQVKYNGVVMHNVLTRLISQEVMYDASDTDKIGTRFTLEFNGVIHSQRVPDGDLTDAIVYSTATGVSVSSSAQAHRVYQELRRRLSEPRKTLQVLVGVGGGGGATLLSVHPMSVVKDQDADIDNGPKPRVMDISSITGNSVYRVRVQFQCATGLSSPGQARVVLNNRWSISESMDSNFFTTRRIEGQMRVAHGLLEAGKGAAEGIPGHAHKYLIVPVLETGFKRDSIDFTVDPNGLDCRYVVVDKQVHTAAPWPATKISAQHKESTTDGVKFQASIHVVLEGPPHVDKRLLIERAVDVAENRLNFIEGSAGEANPLLEYSELVDTIGENSSVELLVRVMQIKERDPEVFTRLGDTEFGSPLELPVSSDGTEYDPKLSPVPTLYGYDPHGGERRPAVLWLLHCYLQTPDNPAHGVNQSGFSTDDETPEQPGRSDTQVSEQPPGTLETRPHDHYNDQTMRAIYTMSKLTSQYVFCDMKVAMPISRRIGQSLISPTNVVFDLSEPQAYRKVVVDVERGGVPPQIATPVSAYQDGTLVGTRVKHDIEMFAPVLSPDGRQQIFRVIATTWYVLNRPPTTAEQLRIGIQSYAKGMTKQLPLSSIYSNDLL